MTRLSATYLMYSISCIAPDGNKASSHSFTQETAAQEKGGGGESLRRSKIPESPDDRYQTDLVDKKRFGFVMSNPAVAESALLALA